MISLEPITIEGLDCLVNSYLTILQHDLGEYQYAFRDTWTFCYNKSVESSIGEAINIPMGIYIDNLKQYYSFESNYISVEPWEMFKENVVKLLKEHVPVIVSVDTYYCNWYDDFGKKHSEHTFLIVGYENKGWNVIDTMPPRVDLKLLDENLRKGIFGAQKVSFFKREKKKDLMQFIVHTLKRRRAQLEQDKLEQFVKDFDKVSLDDEILFDRYVWSVPILRNIRRIYYSRKQFLECTNYLSTERNSALRLFVTENFTPIITDWAVIMNVLYKMQISHRLNQKDKIKQYLEKVVEEEKKFAEELMEAISHPEMLEDYNEAETTEFEQISLEYNEYSHFFETGDFIRKTKLEGGELWVRECVQFQFPEISDKKYNCLLCMGQIIALPKGKIKAIHLIGYATWGNQIAKYQIVDKVETIESELMFSDWCVRPQFGEDILWEGKFIQKETKLEYVGRIFDVKIPMSGRETAGHLKLPNCKEIVLFAVVSERIV